MTSDEKKLIEAGVRNLLQRGAEKLTAGITEVLTSGKLPWENDPEFIEAEYEEQAPQRIDVDAKVVEDPAQQAQFCSGCGAHTGTRPCSPDCPVQKKPSVQPPPPVAVSEPAAQ